MKCVLLLCLSLIVAAVLGWRAGRGTNREAALAVRQAALTKVPALPAPKLTPSNASETSEPVQPPSVVQKMLRGEPLVVTEESLKAYLADNRRNAESLIAAARLTKDSSFLREAAARFPDDPRVQFELAMQSEDPAEKTKALDAFAKLDADNSLPAYLQAGQAFASGDADSAIKYLMEAGQRGSFRDYFRENEQAAEDAMISAGQTPADAKMAAMVGAPVPWISKFNELGKQMESLAGSYANSGDADSAQSLRQMSLAMGDQLRYASNGTLLSDLVGIAVQRRSLQAMEPSTVIVDQGLTAQQMLDRLAAASNDIKTLVRTTGTESIYGNPVLVTQFIERQKSLGEQAALRWLRERIGEKAPP